MNMKHKLGEGKYVYKFEGGRQITTRNGQQWRDDTGDNLILAMATEIQELKEELTNIIDIIEDSGIDYNELIEGY